MCVCVFYFVKTIYVCVCMSSIHIVDLYVSVLFLFDRYNERLLLQSAMYVFCLGRFTLDCGNSSVPASMETAWKLQLVVAAKRCVAEPSLIFKSLAKAPQDTS